MRKVGRYFLWTVGILIGLLALIFALSVGPVDETPYSARPAYQTMQHTLNGLDTIPLPATGHGFSVGYALENITPAQPTAMAGMGRAKPAFHTVHDSLFVRTLVVSNGTETVALVAADMLIVPPTVTRLLKEKLPAIGFTLDQVHLSATHTHSSIGNWGENVGGTFYAGAFSDSLVQAVADHMVHSIMQANKNKQRASLRYGTIPAGKVVYNRLAGDAGGVDSLMRVLEVRRADSTRLILVSYTGHATCAGSDGRALSRDYPGVLVDTLEASGYDFAMFMAGAVGSHGCRVKDKRGWARVEYVGNYLAACLLAHKDKLRPVADSSLVMVRVPLALPPPQVRITWDWVTRPWVFRTLLGEYPVSLTALRMGDVVMLGAPCDFSGELTPPIDSVASSRDVHAMVTSFNGGYIGYITLDRWDTINYFETREMNWYGPGNGAYLSECLIHMLEAVAPVQHP